MDRILEGRLEESLDILAQRFKRGEAQDSGALRPELTARLKTIPVALAVLDPTADWILERRLEESRDVVTQFLSCVETEDSRALMPELAARLKIIPGAPISGRPFEGKKMITDLSSKWPKYQDGPPERSPHRWGFGQEAHGWSPLW